MKIVATHPESQGPFVIINDEDFDPATMTEYKEGAEGPSREEMKAFLTSKGVEFPNNIKAAALEALYAENIGKE